MRPGRFNPRSGGEPTWLIWCYKGMRPAIRVSALGAALMLVVTLVAFHWLGLSFPWSRPGHAQPPPTLSQVQPTPAPVDLYDVMGTLTLNGRTIPAARLLPAEIPLVEWIDKGGIVVNEVRPAEWWPSDRTSMPRIVRGAAVVHAFLVVASAIVIDAVPIAASLNASVCVSKTGDVMTYRLQLVGRTASFDYSQRLHFATYQEALLITADDDTYERLVRIGALPIQAGLCPR